MKSVLLYACLVATLLTLAMSDGGDLSVDFVASAPYTYSHSTGGGAYNDKSIGEYSDVVPSLEGKQFKCSDIVTHLILITVDDQPSDTVQGFTGEARFLGDSTGQSGVCYCADDNLRVYLNNGTDVENGGGGGKGNYGADTAWNTNNNEVLTLEDRGKTNQCHTPGSESYLRFKITNLEAGETAVIRIDITLNCLPDSNPTGNIQASFQNGKSIVGNTLDPIPGGAQTIPLKGVQAVFSVEGCIGSDEDDQLTGVEFTADVVTSSGDLSNGGFIESDFAYSWEYGAYFIQGTNSPRSRLSTFDTVCTILHDGEYLYAQGECGCEEVFIGANQPQLFYETNGGYWNSPTNVTLNGETVKKYTAINGDASSAIEMYLAYDSDNTIRRVVWNDERVMDFTNVVYGPVDPTNFETADYECVCRRNIDIMLVGEYSDDTNKAQVLAENLFMQNLTSDFQLDNENGALFGIMKFDDSTEEILPLLQGDSQQQVTTALNAQKTGFTCNGNKACGDGPAKLAQAVTAAADVLLDESQSRPRVPKAIVVITNDWTDSNSEVEQAIDNARFAGIKVFVVNYNPLLIDDGTASADVIATRGAVAGDDPDNIIDRFSAADLGARDPIDLSSRLCLASKFPCGSSCCGDCDTSCGTCQVVDGCLPDEEGCETSIIVGVCCSTETISSCSIPDGECAEANCVNDECEIVDTCSPPAGESCYNYTCAPSSDGTGPGVCSRALFSPRNACVRNSCVGGSIQETNVSCGRSTSCFDIACEPAEGGCIVTPTGSCSNTCTSDEDCINGPSNCYVGTCISDECEYSYDCNDDNLCTFDTCDEDAGECVSTPIDCEDSDPCTLNVCNEITGSCDSSPVVCDDGISCTKDSCNPDAALGTDPCVYEPRDLRCNDANPCTSGQCVPDDPLADNVTGCVVPAVNCSAFPNATDAYCKFESCIDYEGCSVFPRECAAPEGEEEDSEDECVIYFCNEEEDTCDKREEDCGPPAEVVAGAIGGALGAGAIAGIVVAAIVVGGGICGGAGYAVSTAVGSSEAAPVTNNPLYESKGNGGENPLFSG